MSQVTVEPATVYRAAGRRWFTKEAALKRAAHAMIRRKYPCECEEPEWDAYGGYHCGRHPGNDEYDRLRHRLIRKLAIQLDAEDPDHA